MNNYGQHSRQKKGTDYLCVKHGGKKARKVSEGYGDLVRHFYESPPLIVPAPQFNWFDE